jgi:DNA-directed RNA polymerase
LANENKSLRWETPLGLRVINIYQKPKTKRIKTWPNGRRRDVKFAYGYHDVVRKGKSKNGVAANFVHSFDATHMQMVAIRAAAHDIPMVGVHDCFGCLAPHAARVNRIIREKFVELHKNDFLAAVLQSARDDLPARVKLPSRPERGALDLEQVKQSFFAFS